METMQRFVRSLAVLFAIGASGSAFGSDSVAMVVPNALGTAGETTEGAATPRWSASVDSSPSRYRWSLSRGALDLGMRFDVRPELGRPSDPRFDGAAPLLPTLPALSLGLRSVAGRADPAAGSLLERTVGGAVAETFVRKVGIEWKPAPSRLFLHQGLGIRLDGDDRVTMRLKKGSLGIYMQSDF
jgi:hypothetical protein